MKEFIIEATGITKRYGDIQALAGVEIAVKTGRITLFLGENGAGKTTTLKCLLGFLRPDTGEISMPSGRIGYVPEQPVAFPWMTGWDIMKITCRYHAISPDEYFSLITSTANKIGFEEGLLSRRVQTYSQGNRKKFSYLQNLSFSPSLLIVDEPFSALDPTSIKKVREVFMEIKEWQGTVFMSSHMIAEAEKIVDDVVMIKKGRICFNDESNRFIKSHVMARISIGDERKKIFSPLATYEKNENSENVYLIEKERLSAVETESLREMNISPLNMESVFLFFAG